MRVMFVAPFGMGRKTTVWARTLPLAAALADMDHEVRILVPPWDAPDEAGSVLRHRRVGIHRVDITGGLVPIVTRMLGEIGKFRPEVLHFVKPRAYSGICQWLAYQACGLAGARSPLILLDADDWEQAWNPQLKTWPWVVGFLAWQEEWGLRHAHGVTVASQWLWRRMDAYAPPLAKLYLPNGVSSDVTAASPGAQQGPPTVLWFTRFVEIEPDWLAAFWSALRDRIPDCRLLVAGAPVEPGLEKGFQAVLAADASRVEWLGYVAKDKLPALYARSHCAIAPARESAANLAKCSVRLIDIMAHGVPCVASRVGEQTRFAPFPQVTMLDATAPSAMFGAAVADRLRHPAAAAPPQATGVPTWPALARHLDHFYRTLRHRRQR